MKVKSTRLKKAAGEELIVWSDEPEKPQTTHQTHDEDNVLQFKKQPTQERPEPIKDPNEPQGIPAEDGSTFYSSEFLLWQRELTKESGAPTKKEAVKGYSRATEMYVVKTPTVEGKEKIRFASTNGVLVNKKQA